MTNNNNNKNKKKKKKKSKNQEKGKAQLIGLLWGRDLVSAVSIYQ